MSNDPLAGRVAIVFGSATGIGAACAQTLAARGAVVVVADIEQVAEPLKRLEWAEVVLVEV